MQDHPRRLHPDHRPIERRDQVRRRVDFVSRSGEHVDGTPRRGRGDGRGRQAWQSGGERPIAFVVAAPDSEPVAEDLIEFLRGKVADWWLPDRVIFIDEIPKTGTGKFDKKVVRDQYADVLMEE